MGQFFPRRTCTECGESHRGSQVVCETCRDNLVMRSLKRARRTAIANGHDMERVTRDMMERTWISGCLTCGQVVASDPEEDPPVFGTASVRRCGPVYGPAPRRRYEDMPVVTLIEDEPKERDLPPLSGRHTAGSAYKRVGSRTPGRDRSANEAVIHEWRELEVMA